MEQQMEMDKIMSKIVKLQKQYEGAKKIGSENEAAVAAALLNKLLLQYNLSLEDVTASEQRRDAITHEVISGFEYKSVGGEWENVLTRVVCKYNLCRSYVYGGSYKRLLIVGKEENKKLVKWLLAMLKERYYEFSKTAYKEYKNSTEYIYTRYSKDRFQRAYLLGCAEGLDAKLAAERENQKRQDETFSTQIKALIVQTDAALTNYVETTFGRAGHRTGGRTHASSARQAGFQEGRRTQLYKPIDNTRTAARGALLLK